MRYDRAAGTSTEVTRGFDLQVEELAQSADGGSVYFAAGEKGRNPIYKVALMGGQAQKVVADVYAAGLQVAADDTLVFAGSSMTAPAEIYRGNGGGVVAFTRINKNFISPFFVKKSAEKGWNVRVGVQRQGVVGVIAN